MRGPHDIIYFTGAKATYGVFNNAAAAEGQSADPPFTTDLTDTAHGLLAGSCLYIESTTNYNGLKKIASVPDANSMVIYATYVAETLAGTETWKTRYSSPHPFEFLGFEVHLTSAGATSEVLTVSIDANRGSAFDTEIFSANMNGVTSIPEMFDTPILCEGGDKVDVTWANAGSKTWGIKLFVRRIG